MAGAAVSALVVGGWLMTPVARAADNTPGRQPPNFSNPATVKLAGVSYTEVRPYFAKLGYKATYAADTKTMTLVAGPGSELVFEADSREARLNGLRFFLGEPALVYKGVLFIATLDLERVLLPILRPSRFAARPIRTIVIDAGHGGTDTGTQNKSGKLDEKVFTIDVARRLQRLLADSSWKVIMTRTDDRFVELADRAAIANAAKADLFVSIHFNSVANNPSVRGTETYVLTPQFQHSTSSPKTMPEDKVAQPGNKSDPLSALLGYHMHRQLLAKLKTEDRGFKRARFAVLRLVNCPAVLVEAGYLSNDGEAKKLSTENYRGDIAEALYAAIQAYAATQGGGADR